MGKTGSDDSSLPSSSAVEALVGVSGVRLTALLLEDLERRWQAGERPSVEEYLKRHPQLAEDPDSAAALLLREFLLREKAGETPSADEYLHRFPACADAFAALLRLHRSLAARETPEQATPEPQTGAYTPAGEDELAPLPPPPRGDAEAGFTGVPGYAVLAVLGRGGMGVVYKAQQHSLRRIVALKTILHADHADDRQKRRFQAEAEAVARLQHPHIVQVYEVGEHRGVPYIALEYCAGGSLEEDLDGTPWDVRRAAALVQTVAEAVHAAHQAGIIHRDLKPGNVLLTRDGTPKVSDFGLARRLDLPGHTRTGAIIGTPPYMPPEQASGSKEISPAADVYALGAILYELLTGRPPFKAANPLDTVLQVLHNEPVPVRRLQPTTPRDLETICHKCLEKDPKRRYSSALALAEDLRRFLAGEPVAARPVGPLGRLGKWARRRPAVAALLLLLAIVTAGGMGGIVWAYGKARHEADLARQQSQRADKKAEEAQEQSQRADKNAETATKQAEIAAAKTIEAKQKAEEARTEAAEARRQAYFATIGQANTLLEVRDHGGAAVVLERLDGEHRGWEYGFLRRQAEGTPLTIHGHIKYISSITLRPDGRMIASAGEDGMRGWDAETGRELPAFRQPRSGVQKVAFSPDGTTLAGACNDGTIQLWDAHTAQRTTTLRGHTSGVPTVAFSADGTRLASVAGDSTVRLWDVRAATQIASFPAGALQSNSLAFHPDGTRLAAGIENTVKLWDVESRREVAVLRGHTAMVVSVAFSPDGTRLATASTDKSVRLWDLRAGGDTAVVLRHPDEVYCVAFHPDGTQLATGGKDRAIRLWDPRTGAEVAALHGHAGWVSALAFSADGTRLVSGDWEGAIKLWEVRRSRDVITLGSPRSAACVAFSPDGSQLAGGLSDGTVKLWDTHTGRDLLTLRGHTTGIHAVAFRPDGRLLATSSADGTIKLWYPASGTELATLRGNPQAVLSITFSPDGTRLASGSLDGLVKLWDVRTGREFTTLRGHTFAVTSVAFSPDGTSLASGAGDRTVKVWDASSGHEIITLRGHTNLVNAVAFSPDGTRLASGSADTTVKLWDLHSGRATLTLAGHSIFVSSLAFNRDGSRLISGGYDNLVKVWDTRTGREITTLRGHTGVVSAVTFNRDGTRIASAAGDATIRLWDARTAPEVAILGRHTATVRCVGFSHDSSRLATAADDFILKVWDIPTRKEVLSFSWQPAEAGGVRFGIESVAFSADGRRLVTKDIGGQQAVWDAATGKSCAGEAPPEVVAPSPVSPDGRLAAFLAGSVVHIRPQHPPPGSYDPWAEDAERRRALVPSWHGEDAAEAERRGDALAALVHRRCLAELRPGDALEQYRLARTCFRFGRWSEAQVLCDRLLQHDDRLAPVYCLRASLHQAIGRKVAADLDRVAAVALASANRSGWPAFARDQADEGVEAATRKDWPAARAHFALAALWQQAEPEHLRRRAFVEVAAGDRAAYRQTLRQLYQEHATVADLTTPWKLSCLLAAAPAGPPGLGAVIAPLAADALLARAELHRAGQIIRAAILVPESGIDAAELVKLARKVADADPQRWEHQALLGATLLRAGMAAEAVKALDEAVRLYGYIPSVSVTGFLALAHQRLGHAPQAGQWRGTGQWAFTWEEGVLLRQLQGEFDAALRPGRP
jgi:WD40 repeat protein/tetratricopeptide (TPR) repeat protein/predicted Ser/Thr protein kinase